MAMPIVDKKTTLERFKVGGLKGLFTTDEAESITRIQQLTQGLEMLYNRLSSHSRARDSVEIAIITFDDKARYYLELSNISDVQAHHLNRFKTYNATYMGEGLNMALDCMEDCLKEYSEYDIHYSNPWLIVMSDGEPNGSAEELRGAIRRINSLREKKTLNISAVAIGASANKAIFQEFVSPAKIISIQETELNDLFDDIIIDAQHKTDFQGLDVSEKMKQHIKNNGADNSVPNTAFPETHIDITGHNKKIENGIRLKKAGRVIPPKNSSHFK